MGTIVFFNIRARGHIQPTLAIARELVDRGERVIYFASEEFREMIQATGSEYRDTPGNPYLSPEMTGSAAVLQLGLLKTVKNHLREIQEQVEAEKPDGIVSDLFCIWGEMIARNLQLPMVSSQAFLHMTPDDISMMIKHIQGLKTFPEKVLEIYYVIYASIKILYYRLFKNLPFATIPAFFQPGGSAVLNYSTTEFQIYTEGLGDKFYFTGPPINPVISSSGKLTFSKKLDGRPLVYVSLGTVYNQKPDFFDKVIDGLKDEEVQVVFSRGNNPNILQGTLPENCQVVDFLPQLKMLKKASVFITHGGSNSIHEGFINKVPMVVCPMAADQFVIASRMEELNAGVAFTDGKVTSDEIRIAVRRALEDQDIKKNIQRLSEGMKKAGGARLAADIIQKEFGLS